MLNTKKEFQDCLKRIIKTGAAVLYGKQNRIEVRQFWCTLW